MIEEELNEQPFHNIEQTSSGEYLLAFTFFLSM